jgi:hypothetical protein
MAVEDNKTGRATILPARRGPHPEDRGGQQPDRPSAWSSEQRPSWMRDGMEVKLYEGREDLEVVGEASYQDNLWRIIRERRSPDGRVREEVYAVLAAEPDNPYDANAVAVWIQGLKVGYPSREDARRYRPGLQALEQQHGRPIALAGVIAGGGMRADGPGRLGVFLEHDPADFGLRPMQMSPPAGSAMRTGLSDALATDDADDAYGLRWMSDLPPDDLRAIRCSASSLGARLTPSTDTTCRPTCKSRCTGPEASSRRPWTSTTRRAASTTPRWTASGSPSWPSGAGCRCWSSTGRWPYASRRPRASSRRCGGGTRHGDLWDRLCSGRSG